MSNSFFKKESVLIKFLQHNQLKSYEAAKKKVMKNVEHRQHKGLNNRAENSHQPTTMLLATNAEIQTTRASATISICI